MKKWTDEDMNTIIRCCWNASRELQDGSICDPKQLKIPQLYKYSWIYNWSDNFLKKLKKVDS